ncbi:MAG: hypothetical protein Q3M24_21555 [Candidatus Electrothrix aestuarii]|uniref:Uncharacterized protein n=1 Tax=Candidatus Electrothrix aestuarii TaxID=3062594 RepID=A0AAU8LVH0_9BACT|nr:hypothetical protein [Candidatus Electrothrix aestuarii]
MMKKIIISAIAALSLATASPLLAEPTSPQEGREVGNGVIAVGNGG